MDNKDRIIDSERMKEELQTPLSVDFATDTCENLFTNIADSRGNATKEESTMSNGFIKLSRSDKVIKLIEEYPMAFALLSIIALRATRFDCAITGLKAGEAKITCLDLVSRQIYRSALLKLQVLHFVTIRTTNRFTIAKLCSSDIYDINNNLDNQQSNQQATIRQPSEPSTRIDNKKKRNKEEYMVASLPKLKFGMFVCLTEQEYKTLCDANSKEIVDESIEEINDYCESTGKRYKGFAATIRGWIKRGAKNAKPTSKRDSESDNMIWASQFNHYGGGWTVHAEPDAWKASAWNDQTKHAWISYKTQGFTSQVEQWLRLHNLWHVVGAKL